MYLTYSEYTVMTGATISMTDFSRLEFDAEMVLDRHTTGIDNVRKLRVAFPTDDTDAQAIKRCMAALVDALTRFENADKTSVPTTGAVTLGAVSSVSSGSESISYAAGVDASAMAAGVKSIAGREAYCADVVRKYLSGREDANGVNLMFMGRYPKCISTL